MLNSRSRLAFLVVILFLPACYRMVKPDVGLEFQNVPDETKVALSLVRQRNNDARPFKGIGKISVWDSAGSQTSRAAWVGSPDGRLRIEFLGLPGQPVAKLIFDGSRYYFLSHLDQQSYHKSCADPDLKPVTGVSITAGEVIAYLAGGIPIYEHDVVSFEQAAPGSQEVLIFKKNWLGVVEKIFFNGVVIEKIEIFKWGKLTYRVEFSDVRDISGHQIPFYMVITSGERLGFGVSIDRYWADIDVTPAMFEILPAE